MKQNTSLLLGVLLQQQLSTVLSLLLHYTVALLTPQCCPAGLPEEAFKTHVAFGHAPFKPRRPACMLCRLFLTRARQDANAQAHT